jgi:hypothetical protein
MTDIFGNKSNTIFIIVLFAIQFFFWNGTSFEQFDEDSEEVAKNVLWQGTRNIQPKLEIVPAVPSEEIIKSSSLGDDQFAFRSHSYKLQFAGDTFGRSTPLKDYDYEKLYKWWVLLDDIDSRSNWIAYLVAYYFSATQSPKEQVPYVVDFLEYHSDKNPEKKWWWLSQAVYNAKFKSEDSQRALGLAKKLASLPNELDIPIWTRQLEAFIYEDQGEYEKACDIIVNVVKNFSDNQLTEGELNFIHHFVQERLRAMIDASEKREIQVSEECMILMETQKAADLRERGQELRAEE